MKKIILDKYKYINILLLIIVLITTISIYFYVQGGSCIDSCSLNVKKGILNPIFSGGKWLAGILAVFIFIPSHIFRKWLLYIAPIIILITIYLAQGISVYSTNLLNPTRAKMAENGMFVLAVVTFIFVLLHLIRDRKK